VSHLGWSNSSFLKEGVSILPSKLVILWKQVLNLGYKVYFGCPNFWKWRLISHPKVHRWLKNKTMFDNTHLLQHMVKHQMRPKYQTNSFTLLDLLVINFLSKNQKKRQFLYPELRMLFFKESFYGVRVIEDLEWDLQVLLYKYCKFEVH